MADADVSTSAGAAEQLLEELVSAIQQASAAEFPEVHSALSTWLPDQFCTGIFTPLHMPTGVLRWSDCGHPLHEAALEPGDRILLYTDGVVESHNEGGEQFGLDRFTDHIVRSTAAGQNEWWPPGP